MDSIKDLFYKGEYSKVLQETYITSAKSNLDYFSYVIGSLSFLGRLQEAESYYKNQESQLNHLQKSYSYFFLAIGFTRRSNYRKAKKFLKLNQEQYEKSNNKEAEIQFLVSQGIAFYLYFIGKFEKSASWGNKAMAAAFTQKDRWMMGLSYDLFANILIQNGKIYEGLRYFGEALSLASQIENENLYAAIETSELIFRCEYGIKIAESFTLLERKYKAAKEVDAFSKANLGLEYVRQLTLRGKWNQAVEILEGISPMIYRNQNRRQEARFNLRWAELHFFKNQPALSLHYLRSGKRCLEFVDQTYEIQFLGLEIKIYEKLKYQHSESYLQEIKGRLLDLSERYQVVKNNHILQRQKWIQPKMKTDSDDEIHNILIQMEEGFSVAQNIILETGFFSWLYRSLKINYGENYILLNFENRSITCVSANGINHIPDSLSNLNYKILITLAKGFVTKENLVNEVWDYNYDPLRHDSMIYSALSNLRKILDLDAHFIETSELGYKLSAKLINFAMIEKGRSSIDEEKWQSAEAVILKDNDISVLFEKGLNSRQIQIMDFLTKHQFISVKIAMQIFGTSEITANRDLRSLFEKGFVIRVGRGRATQYSKRI